MNIGRPVDMGQAGHGLGVFLFVVVEEDCLFFQGEGHSFPLGAAAGGDP